MFSAVPGHDCFDTIMRYYLNLAKISSINKNSKLSNKYKILSILIPTLIHGTYDYCLFSSNLLITLLIFIDLILYIYTIYKINIISKKSKKIQLKNINKFCSNCDYKTESDYHSNCDTKMNND